MSQIIPSTFTQYQQDKRELLAGMALGVEQKHFIQTQIAMLAEQRLALVPDPLHYSVFVQQEAHLKGQMDGLKYLLDCSTSAEQQHLEAAEAEA